jgi:hypothetical protein
MQRYLDARKNAYPDLAHFSKNSKMLRLKRCNLVVGNEGKVHEIEIEFLELTFFCKSKSYPLHRP